MAVDINITPDKGAIAAWEKATKGFVKPAEFNKALARAINDALKAQKTQAKREISQRFTIKQKDISEYIKERKATSSTLGAELRFIGPGIPALRFKVKPAEPRPAKRPIIIIQYKKDGGGPAPGKFVAVMKSGHRGVFERIDGEYMKKNPLRQAITEIMGPSAAGMVGGPEVREAIQARANEVLSSRLEHHMERLLDK